MPVVDEYDHRDEQEQQQERQRVSHAGRHGLNQKGRVTGAVGRQVHFSVG
jgi:hypothetical protein